MKCYLPGIPRMTYLGWPFQIIQTPEYVTFVYEWAHKKRVVPINSTRRRRPKTTTAWMGMARGRYEGNSLVINLTNFNSYTWFDMAGNYHSDELQVVERYTPINADTLQYEATMTDPKVFTRPWTIRMTLQRQKDIGTLDYECTAMFDEIGIHHTWPRDFDVKLTRTSHEHADTSSCCRSRRRHRARRDVGPDRRPAGTPRRPCGRRWHEARAGRARRGQFRAGPTATPT